MVGVIYVYTGMAASEDKAEAVSPGVSRPSLSGVCPGGDGHHLPIQISRCVGVVVHRQLVSHYFVLPKTLYIFTVMSVQWFQGPFCRVTFPFWPVNVADMTEED